ncbi:MAG: ECF-type sigma factor [Myxococcota bacterium]|nr:ECF-type sigma factor [Myxococcota bacterium]
MGSTEDYYERLYQELRGLAQKRVMAGGNLEPTELVAEVYVKLQGRAWADTEHFWATAAKAMRQVLVDRARYRARDKRPDPALQVTLNPELHGAEPAGPNALLEIDQALSELEASMPRAAQVAEMRVFAGMTHEEIARVLGVSDRTVKTDWRAARAFLKVRLQ